MVWEGFFLRINNSTRFIVIVKSSDDPQLCELSDDLSRDSEYFKASKRFENEAREKVYWISVLI